MEIASERTCHTVRRWAPPCSVAIALVGLAGGACPEARAETTFTVGAAVGAAPRYEGSNEYQVLGAPMLRADFGNGAFIDLLQGAGYTYKFTNGMFVTGALGYATGRTDSKRADLSGSDYLKGMGKIPGSVMGVFQIGVPVYGGAVASLTLDVPLTHRERGLSGHVDLAVPVYHGGMHTVTLTPSVHFGSRSYTQTFFGVTDAQSAASRFRPYSTKSGIDSASLSLSWGVALSRAWSVSSMVVYTRLVGDAAGSPIVQTRQSVFGMTSINYTF